MNRWMVVALLVLMILASAMGLKALTTQTMSANTSGPMPPSPWLVANTSGPMPPSPWLNTSGPMPPSPW